MSPIFHHYRHYPQAYLNDIPRRNKPMSEEDATKAYRQLLKLEGVMLASGLFTEQELHEDH